MRKEKPVQKVGLTKPVLKLCTDIEFFKEARNFPLKNSVNYPYSAAEIIKAKNATTDGACSCIATGLLKPFTNVIMGHIAPNKNNIKNYNIMNFEEITNKISALLDKKGDYTHNLLFGGTEKDSSKKLLENFENFYTKEGIPYSKINVHKVNCPLGSDLGCNAEENKFFITNPFISEQLKQKKASFVSMSGTQIQNQLKQILDDAFKNVDVSQFEIIA